jgi:hypothetical protein
VTPEPETPVTTTMLGCGKWSNGASGTALLPATPFYAPRYHFGMLLGVDDFESEQAYHRGKMRLHNAWLHGEGVVWGMLVEAPLDEGGGAGLSGELRVQPGLALDDAGRELYLAGPVCVSVPAWYLLHKDDPEVKAAVTVADDGTVTLEAHVVARFRACLARQVPAISEPCVGSGGDTAFSRAQETAELLLVPGPAPARVLPYHRLRLLFSLEPPRTEEDGTTVLAADAEVVQARDQILALPAVQQPAAYLDAFRRFAALDEIDRGPAVTEDGDRLLFPAPDDDVVVLAAVHGITLEPAQEPGGEEAFTLIDVAIDNTIRAAHVATATIQELLCGPLFALAAAAAEGAEGEAPPPPPEDAGGPRVVPASVKLEGGETVTFTVDKPLSKASVAREAFAIWAYDNRDGWREVEIARDPVVDKSGKRVRVELKPDFGGNLVREIAHGSGPAPLLGTSLIPLAGVVGGPPGGATDGNDAVLMIKRSEQ